MKKAYVLSYEDPSGHLNIITVSTLFSHPLLEISSAVLCVSLLVLA